MKAAYVEAAGGPEQIRVGDLPAPEPRSDQLLVRNHAAGVGPWDWKALSGRWGELKFPHIPGAEAAGVVEQAPEGSRFSAGEEVWGRARHAYAEYIVSDGAALVPKPVGLSFEDAAALVISGATAHEGIIDRLRLQPGETIVVTSAAGGVGSAAVQIAASTGARVIGICSAGSFDDVRALGAAEVFDYHDAGWTDAVRDVVPGGADALFDSAGAETGQTALKALRDGARVSLVAYPMPDLSVEGRGISGEAFSAASTGATFAALGSLIEAGKLRSYATHVYPLEQAREALEASQAGHTHGKIVLRT
ncbi:MAG TPA: NADP-dependent oxidoreductase [Candidatus Solibacter sp.]|jgi:NADPH:quinone reductase-like Zn-dependent oxidoreductase|nr:NADP-dependent oxidoreductase [Candidatus Solibacter sp.]